MKKFFTLFVAALMSVGMWAEPITVTWNGYDLPSSGTSFTKDGVTLTCTIDDDVYGPGTFTTDLGNFTQIVVSGDEACYIDATDGWSGNINQKTWTGNAASVSWGGTIYSFSYDVTFVFTIEPAGEPEPVDPNREYLSLDPSAWSWGYNSVPEAVEGGIKTTIVSDWGALSMGWDPERDLSEWDKIVFEVSHMDGCAGNWFKLKAYLRDESDSEGKQMEGLLGLDAVDNDLNYLVIDLHQEVEGFDLTKARVLAVQCEPTGGIFTISSAYLLKESEPEPAKERVIFGVNVPANGKPESIELVGSFIEGGWDNGIVLTVSETGWYISYEVYANADDEFKIRAAGSWDNEIFVRTETGWTATQNIKFGDVWVDDTYKGDPVKWLELDLSGDNYGWKTAVQSIENIELTEQAQKVVVDGVIYIVRDGKMFDLTGAQVR